MQLTNEEIQFIKNLYSENQKFLQQVQKNTERDIALQKIADKYKPLLDEAEQNGDFELRKNLIEQLTIEAREEENKIINSN